MPAQARQIAAFIKALDLGKPLILGHSLGGAIALALARQGWLVRHGDAFSVQDAVKGLRITISNIEPAQCTRLAQDLKHSLG